MFLKNHFPGMQILRFSRHALFIYNSRFKHAGFRLFLFFVVTISILFHQTSAAITLEANLGLSTTSPYQYLDLNNSSYLKWVEFNSTTFLCGDIRASANILTDDLSIGILFGFLNRYTLTKAERSDLDAPLTKTNIGAIYSIPMIGYIEDRVGPLFFQAGAGPFLSPIVINDPGDTIGFINQSFFGFLFGGEYTFAINNRIEIPVKLELLVNAPIVLFDFLPQAVQTTYAESRDNDTYQYSSQSVLYNITMTVGFRYKLLENFNIWRWDAIAPK